MMAAGLFRPREADLSPRCTQTPPRAGSSHGRRQSPRLPRPRGNRHRNCRTEVSARRRCCADCKRKLRAANAQEKQPYEKEIDRSAEGRARPHAAQKDEAGDLLPLAAYTRGDAKTGIARDTMVTPYAPRPMEPADELPVAAYSPRWPRPGNPTAPRRTSSTREKTSRSGTGSGPAAAASGSTARSLPPAVPLSRPPWIP